MDEVERARLRERMEGQSQWLNEICPYVFADQKHLLYRTPERAYWHYGYMTALQDVLALVERGRG